MSRRTTAPLLVLLLLASVAHAAQAAPFGSFAAGPDLFARAWDFLERLWKPSPSPGVGESRGGSRAIRANNGMCIDPDGKPAAGCAGQVIWSDGGVCIDPDGKPAAGCAGQVIWSDGGVCIDPNGKPAAGCAGQAAPNR